MTEWLSHELRDQIADDFGSSYEMFDHFRVYLPSQTECTTCGGVDAEGEPYDITCADCEHGYTWTWVIQEVRGRVADVALVTQLFVSITPGIQLGDKLLLVPECDAPTLQAIEANQQAYVFTDSAYWRPRSVRASQIGNSSEWVVHLVKFSPEVVA